MVDSSKWGQKRWGAFQYGYSSISGNSHSLRTRVGFNSRVWANRLSVTHHLSTELRFESQTHSLGYGPAPIHPLQTTMTLDSVVSSTLLKWSHPLLTNVRMASLVEAAPLRHLHLLETNVSFDTFTAGRLGIPHFIETTARLGSLVEAAGLRIGHSLRTSARLQSRVSAIGITELHLPTIIEILSPLDPTQYVVGFLNIIPNPALTLGLEGWEAYGGASLSLDTDHAWTGEQSARLGGSLLGAQGLTIQAAQGLRLQPYGGSILWSGVKLAADNPSMEVAVWTRAAYLDGTIVDGEAVVVLIVGDGIGPEGWDLVQAPFLSLDDDRLLSTAWIVVQPVALLGDLGSLYVGAAQMEYDLMMYGPAPSFALEAAA